MDILIKYFPALTAHQIEKLEQLKPIYEDWNAKVNLISRKDIDQFYERHVLHSLSIAKVVSFPDESKIMDLGTGGGFPGIPLAILFPNVQFDLVDSIGKKINVVNDVAHQLKLDNVKGSWKRAEELVGHYDFVVTRAVTQTIKLLAWTKNKSNHIYALKGGNLKDEILTAKKTAGKRLSVKTYPLNKIFEEEFFETKTILEIKR